jgi:Smg protein
MKESVLDVLMYLFENYRLGEYSDADNHTTLRTELLGAGFPDEEIQHAFRWLDGLGHEGQLPLRFGPGRAIRVYARQEMDKLATECRGFLMYLEQLGILSPENRELVIDRLMAIEDEVDIERTKWVVLLVLVNQPGSEEQAVQVEDMVYYSGDWLH